MPSRLQDLIDRGIADLEKGDRKAAHKRFLEALKLDPKNVTALAFAAGSSANREAADMYLHRARGIAPDHPIISKGLEWSKTLPAKTEARQTDVQQLREDYRPTEARWDAKQGAKPKTWFVVIGLTLLVLSGVLCVLLLLAGYNYSQPDAYATQVAQVVQMTRSAQIDSSATMQESSPTRTATPTTSLTVTPTLTPSITPTASSTQTETSQPTVVVYPQIDYLVFTSNPELYAGVTLMLSGRVVSFGEVIIGEDMGFGIQIGPDAGELEDETSPRLPVLVLNIPPDPAIRLNDRITIYGRGAEDLGEIIVLGLKWIGPVILGEKIQPFSD
ncbi:MAG: hypothetical protein MUO76_10835 [Anaerolineaceae bacterium]|nr:hypothetical protein [Anaerolineaceae bacterium]